MNLIEEGIEVWGTGQAETLHCPIFYTASRFVWDIRDWRSAYGLVKGLSINALKEQSVFDIGNEAIALTYCHVKIAAHI